MKGVALNRPVDWTEATVARLTALWGEGATSRQIADILSYELRQTVTRSAVIGKVQRLGLPGRGNPIRTVRRFARSAGGASAPARTALTHMSRDALSTDPTALPDLKSPVPLGKGPDVPTREGISAPGQRHRLSRLETAAPASSRTGRFLGVSSLNSTPAGANPSESFSGTKHQIEPLHGVGVAHDELRHGLCQWPLWGDDRPSVPRFCGCRPIEGRPYCAGHAAHAYLKPKKPEAGTRTIAETFHTGVARNSVFELRAGVR